MTSASDIARRHFYAALDEAKAANMAGDVIVYGATEGQTRKTAEFVSDRIRAHGHRLTLSPRPPRCA